MSRNTSGIPVEYQWKDVMDRVHFHDVAPLDQEEFAKKLTWMMNNPKEHPKGVSAAVAKGFKNASDIHVYRQKLVPGQSKARGLCTWPTGDLRRAKVEVAWSPELPVRTAVSTAAHELGHVAVRVSQGAPVYWTHRSAEDLARTTGQYGGVMSTFLHSYEPFQRPEEATVEFIGMQALRGTARAGVRTKDVAKRGRRAVSAGLHSTN